MDLLSFSSITVPISRKHQTEGLPLKAVYRDTVVGIRYFYGREDGITPVYRRFQISFLSASDASEFIALIKPVCPCRLNPTSASSFAVTPQSQLGNSIITPQVPISQANLISKNALLPNRGYPFVYTETTHMQPANVTQPGFVSSIERPPLSRSVTLSSPLRQEPYPDSEISRPTNSTRPPLQVAPNPLQASSQDLTSHRCPREPTKNTVVQEQSFISDINAVLSQRINVPSSSLPSIPSSSAPNMNPMPLNNSPATFDKQDSIAPTLAQFVEAASIYNLSDVALEQVIAEIINEEGFIQLVEKVSEMTTVRRVASV
ncbi:hypothetical protein BDN70DRAFT_879525 [Pholiota conissans]|uniref:Uncharacterized protein n=1 Tax=Pholiota conissans TaxID=109636 RepID=A0A9P5YZW4_9AGAR|nr:hypothetical protein BDN70DRAFT_879525 [Pholiota conissans]